MDGWIDRYYIICYSNNDRNSVNFPNEGQHSNSIWIWCQLAIPRLRGPGAARGQHPGGRGFAERGAVGRACQQAVVRLGWWKRPGVMVSYGWWTWVSWWKWWRMAWMMFEWVYRYCLWMFVRTDGIWSILAREKPSKVSEVSRTGLIWRSQPFVSCSSGKHPNFCEQNMIGHAVKTAVGDFGGLNSHQLDLMIHHTWGKVWPNHIKHILFWFVFGILCSKTPISHHFLGS